MKLQKRQPSYQWQNHLRTLRGWKTRRHNDYWRDFWARFYIILVFTLGLIAMALIGYMFTKAKEINDIQLHEQYLSQVIEKQIPLKFTSKTTQENAKTMQVIRVEAKKPIIPTKKPETPKKKEYTNPHLPDWKVEVVKIIKEYDWDWRIASATFYAESGFNPVMNSIGACGVTQLYTCPNINWRDARTNIDYAYWHKYIPSLKRRGNGWLPWVAYTTGKHKQYLYMF